MNNHSTNHILPAVTITENVLIAVNPRHVVIEEEVQQINEHFVVENVLLLEETFNPSIEDELFATINAGINVEVVDGHVAVRELEPIFDIPLHDFLVGIFEKEELDVLIKEVDIPNGILVEEPLIREVNDSILHSRIKAWLKKQNFFEKLTDDSILSTTETQIEQKNIELYIQNILSEIPDFEQYLIAHGFGELGIIQPLQSENRVDYNRVYTFLLEYDMKFDHEAFFGVNILALNPFLALDSSIKEDVLSNQTFLELGETAERTDLYVGRILGFLPNLEGLNEEQINILYREYVLQNDFSNVDSFVSLVLGNVFLSNPTSSGLLDFATGRAIGWYAELINRNLNFLDIAALVEQPTNVYVVHEETIFAHYEGLSDNELTDLYSNLFENPSSIDEFLSLSVITFSSVVAGVSTIMLLGWEGKKMLLRLRSRLLNLFRNRFIGNPFVEVTDNVIPLRSRIALPSTSFRFKVIFHFILSLAFLSGDEYVLRLTTSQEENLSLLLRNWLQKNN